MYRKREFLFTEFVWSRGLEDIKEMKVNENWGRKIKL